VRRLIRQEAKRIGIVLTNVDSTAPAVDRAIALSEAGAGGGQVGEKPASTDLVSAVL